MTGMSLVFNALRRFGHRVHLQLGAIGLLGIGLLALAGIALLYASQTVHEAERLQTLTERARERVAKLDAEHTDRVSPAERLARFQKWFPDVLNTTADLRKIFKAADASHVTLAKGEYSLTAVEGSSDLRRFDVIFPVKERYAPVKGFVADVLNQLPHASLAELHVERPGSAADQLDSRVHFTLFYRAHES